MNKMRFQKWLGTQKHSKCVCTLLLVDLQVYRSTYVETHYIIRSISLKDSRMRHLTSILARHVDKVLHFAPCCQEMDDNDKDQPEDRYTVHLLQVVRVCDTLARLNRMQQRLPPRMPKA